MSARKWSALVVCMVLALLFLLISLRVHQNGYFTKVEPRIEIKSFDLRKPKDTVKIKLHFSKSIFEDDERPNVEVEVFV